MAGFCSIFHELFDGGYGFFWLKNAPKGRNFDEKIKMKNMAFSGPKTAQRRRYGHFYVFGLLPLKSQWEVSIAIGPKHKRFCNSLTKHF